MKKSRNSSNIFVIAGEFKCRILVSLTNALIRSKKKLYHLSVGGSSNKFTTMLCCVFCTKAELFTGLN